MAKRKIKVGDKIRLKYDVTTNGGVRFRAGLTMRVEMTCGEYYLSVSVRGKRHSLRLKKKDEYLLTPVESTPESEDSRADHTD